MYFNLPKRKNRIDGGLYSEDTLSDHIMNLEDHRHSPIILTPRTLSFILDHQWENEAADVHPSSAFKREYNCSTDHDNKMLMTDNMTKEAEYTVYQLIKEVCKTIELIDNERKHQITGELMSDPVIHRIIHNSTLNVPDAENDHRVLKHLIHLLQSSNNRPLV